MTCKLVGEFDTFLEKYNKRFLKVFYKYTIIRIKKKLIVKK